MLGKNFATTLLIRISDQFAKIVLPKNLTQIFRKKTAGLIDSSHIIPKTRGKK
jgi:hypothetical protein